MEQHRILREKDIVNPCSLILSGEMLLRYLGWTEAADKLLSAIDKTIQSRKVTSDFAMLMNEAHLVAQSLQMY